MKCEKISVRKLISDFNKSELHHKMIPMGMASGWPCIRTMGNTLCITIPYFSRSVAEDKVALNAIYCSVTVPVMNPDRLMDFTIYPYKREWEDVDYENPVGFFPHEALEGLKRTEYKALCDQLYDCYDLMVESVRNQEEFKEQDQMIALFSRLMEPAHFPQYLRINKMFYSVFCRL